MLKLRSSGVAGDDDTVQVGQHGLQLRVDSSQGDTYAVNGHACMWASGTHVVVSLGLVLRE